MGDETRQARDGRRQEGPHAEPDDAPRTRGRPTRRRSKSSRSVASSQAAMAMARAMPGRPERPDQDDGEGRVDDDGQDRREDRRQRVLAGVERAGQDGDQGVRDEADQEREQGGRGQLDRRSVESRRTAGPRSRRAGSRPTTAIGSITNVRKRSARVSRPTNSTRLPLRDLARQRREEHDAERHADDPDRDLEQGEGDGEGGHGAETEGPWRGP